MRTDILIWAIAGLSTAGVIGRPFRLPEAVWAVAGAASLVVLGLLPWHAAWQAARRGTDVYLFLTGMMLLSELARREGLFDWIAALAVRRARGSASRLFVLIYGVGTLVTVFLSNDATAVVMTPAVFAATRAAKIEQPLPYLFICAIVANAASFVLPISNPANLVLYASRTPPLLSWLAHYAVPSTLSILVTYALLRLTQRAMLRRPIATAIDQPPLSGSGRTVGLGIALTAIMLLVSSSLGMQLGLPTALAGLATVAAVLALNREPPWPVLRGISWTVLPLVAGLFVLVEGVDHTGLLHQLAGLLRQAARDGVGQAAFAGGVVLAMASNLMNNLPAGLIAADTIAQAKPPAPVVEALLIGVDLGPNLSVTGSLATILWLAALRRDGEEVGFWQFLRLGAVVMPPALLLALAGLLLTS